MTLVRPAPSSDLRGQAPSELPTSKRAWFGVVCVLIVAAVLVWQWRPIIAWVDPLSLYHSMVRSAVRYLPFTAPMAVMLLFTFALERVIPISRSSETGGRGFCEDLVYFLMAAPATVLTTFWFSRGLQWLFDHPLQHVRVNLSDVLPWSVVFVICFVLGDFLGWANHYVKHKVPFLWRFHLVHHTAIDLSPLTDARVHYFEFFIVQFFVSLPLFLLGGDVTGAVTFVVLLRLSFARFNHGNIRTHFGPFGQLFVSPQYHRLHHSLEPRDIDKNFGGIFTIWDRMFGTQAEDGDRYTRNGVDEPDFPRASNRMPTTLAWTYLQQLAYPFRRQAAHVPAGRAARPS